MSIQRSSIVRKTQLTLAGLLVFLLNSSLVIGQPATNQKPNVIFILADDLGYGDLGCFGQKLIKTPNIDRLAKEGTRFTQAYAGATVCAPSRCSLMTGKHNGHAAIRGNQEVQPEGQVPMPSDTFTVGHLMKLAGYKTGLIGKWGLGIPAQRVLQTKWALITSLVTTANARPTSTILSTCGAMTNKSCSMAKSIRMI